MRRLVWGLLVLVGIGLVGIVPAGPADAAPAQAPARRPVLLVGGTFAAKQALEEDVKPWLLRSGYTEDEVFTAQLATAPGLPAWIVDEIREIGEEYDTHTSGAGTALMGRHLVHDPDRPDEPPPLTWDTSAHALDHAVTDALAATGADEIDIIAHSQGAAVARHYVKFYGQDKVAGLVSLGGVNYGIPRETGSWLGDLLFRLVCQVPVCDQVFYGTSPAEPSQFFIDLNSSHSHFGGPTPGDIDYYHLYTWSDEQGRPGTQRGETLPLIGNATNVAVQDLCPGLTVHHIDEFEHPAMQDMMLAALERRPITSRCQQWTPRRCVADPGAPVCDGYPLRR